MSLRILVFFPHPDDAILFAGGSLARWVQEGHHVTAICCTKGDLGTLDANQGAARVAAIRESELRTANKIVGIQETVVLPFPDGGILDRAELRQELIGCVREHRPDRVLTLDPWVPYEVHPDHEAVGRMAAEAATFAPFPLLHPGQLTPHVRPHSVSEVWFMGPLARRPNCCVDIASTIDVKIRAALTLAATMAIVASLAGPEVGCADPAKQAERWLRDSASRIGQGVGVSAAEAFLVQPCRPGHFGNMHQLIDDMLGLSPEAPKVV